MNFKNNPVVIGAVGGSGTRIFTKIIRYAGIYMGSDLNKAEENEDNKSFYHAWLPLYVHKNGCLPESVQEALSNDFYDLIQNHLAEIPSEDDRWGLKHPKNLLMIKFWNEIFPQMKFLHVVRNGLDMVYSMKQSQYQTYQWFFLDKENQHQGSKSKILFWSKVNQEAAKFGETYLKDRYLRIRFEDLCSKPEQVVPQIFDFIEAPNPSQLEKAISEVSLPKTMGRWRSQPVQVVHQLMKTGQPGLEQFGYWNSFNWQQIDKAVASSPFERYFFQRIGMKNLSL